MTEDITQTPNLQPCQEVVKDENTVGAKLTGQDFNKLINAPFYFCKNCRKKIDRKFGMMIIAGKQYCPVCGKIVQEKNKKKKE